MNAASCELTSLGSNCYHPGMKQIGLRLDEGLIQRIDNLRGLVPREAWIRSVLDDAVWENEQAAKNAPHRENDR